MLIQHTVSVHWERLQEKEKFWTQCGVTVVLINSKVNILLSVKLFQRKSKLLYIYKYTLYFWYHTQMPFDLPALTLPTTRPLICTSSARHRALNFYIYIYIIYVRKLDTFNNGSEPITPKLTALSLLISWRILEASSFSVSYSPSILCSLGRQWTTSVNQSVNQTSFVWHKSTYCVAPLNTKY